MFRCPCHPSAPADRPRAQRITADSITPPSFRRGSQGLLLRALPDLGYVSPKQGFESGDIRQNRANTAPIGIGPFRFVQYERGQFIIAERNPNYWRNNMPYLDRIVRRIITDRPAAAAQLEADQVLFAPYSSLSIADMQRLGRDPRFEATTRGNEGNVRTNTLEFNFRTPVLADICVRRALAHAINVPFFIEDFLGPFAKPGTGPIPSVSADYDPGAGMPQYGFDLALANRLLDEAGHRRGAGGVRFSLRLHPAPWGKDIALWSTFLQQSLSQVGIRLEVARLTRAEFLTLRTRDFVQACRIQGLGDAHLILREVLPNALPPVIVYASVVMAVAILLESALAFLQLSDPNVPSWGNLIGLGRNVLRAEWYVSAIPGLAILLTILGVSLVGQGLNDALNPRLASHR